MDLWNQIISPLLGSPWIYVLIFAFVLIDAFFPPIPSEVVVVALAALSASTGTPEMYLLIAATVAGAVCGDNIAYLFGRFLGQERISGSKWQMVARASMWARKELNRRPVLIILTAREIPVGRTAVNITAGATGFPWHRFAPISAIAGAAWAGYTFLIAVFAGVWFDKNPILAMTVAVLLSFMAGFCIDRAFHLLSNGAR
ncbi:DedA family protein [Devosia sp. RR2S18]|uniref:DedA family protein n=1 Tax=Devosia rhizosphaerae TaxID=3049774 RepID=UPI002541AD36|nr:DedA family protein [Devosia sp. RR2S18]WIJ25852.1 DedA family protein [Devosia sp. RR2S18]